jgi:sulfatase modifying factor 1
MGSVVVLWRFSLTAPMLRSHSPAIPHPRRMIMFAKPFAILTFCNALVALTARADVFNMAPGLTSVQFVTVGNAGNAPDTRVNIQDGTTGYGSVGYVYRMGKYEITAGQYTQFLNAVAKADPNALYNTAMDDPIGLGGANILQTGSSPNFSYSVAADWANRPVNYVNFWDAARFANWLDNGQPTGAQGPGTTEDGAYHDVGSQTLFGRNEGAKFFIPTEDEWYKAAYHNKSAGLAASYFGYPTGSNAAPINTLPDTGNHANFHDNDGIGNSGYTIGSPTYRTEVGAFANSASPYGTFDQGGNVTEWTETIVRGGRSRRLRGSNYVGPSYYLSASIDDFYDPPNADSGLGFRVGSVVPEPSTGVLAILAIGITWCWRRHFKTSATTPRRSLPAGRSPRGLRGRDWTLAHTVASFRSGHLTGSVDAGQLRDRRDRER